MLSEVGKLENTSFLVLDTTELFQSFGELKETIGESLSRFLQQLPKSAQHLGLIANDPVESPGLRLLAAFCDALIEIAPTIKTILPASHTFAIGKGHTLDETFAFQTKLMNIIRALAIVGVRVQLQGYDRTLRTRVDVITREMEEEDWL